MPLPGLSTPSIGLITVVPGSVTYDTPGSHNFTVPHYNTLTVELWGGGGGAVGLTGNIHVNGTSGGASTFNGMSAGGGTRGNDTSGGSGGTASGGSVNMNGNPGGNGSSSASGAGGSAPNGGSGGSARSSTSDGRPGNDPGGGGSGAYSAFVSIRWGAGGGSGAYVSRTYGPGDLTPGFILEAIVGNRGTGGNGDARDGGRGGYGRVKITWS